MADYLAARERKLRLSDEMFRCLEGTAAGQFRVLVGIDDSSEEDSIQKNEIAYLRAQLREGDALLSGVDDLAFKAVTKLYLEESGWDGAAVSVQYFGGTEDQPACAYDYQPLEVIMAEHFDFFGLTAAEPGAEELQVLVLTQPADPAVQQTYFDSLIRCLNDNREAGLPTILIDAGNGTYGTAFHEALTERAELGWLISYAGFLDMAIVTGTALSHGVARYAFLQNGEQTEAAERAFIRTVADSILKDFCYKNIVRNDILNFVRSELQGNADNFWTPDINREAVLDRLETGMAEAAAPVIENLERSNFISALPPLRSMPSGAGAAWRWRITASPGTGPLRSAWRSGWGTSQSPTSRFWASIISERAEAAVCSGRLLLSGNKNAPSGHSRRGALAERFRAA